MCIKRIDELPRTESLMGVRFAPMQACPTTGRHQKKRYSLSTEKMPQIA